MWTMPCGVLRGLVGGEGEKSHWGKDGERVVSHPCEYSRAGGSGEMVL